MTTKFLDNKICNFKFFFSRGVSHEKKKQRFGRFPSLPPNCPPPLPPSKPQNFIFIVVSPSLTQKMTTTRKIEGPQPKGPRHTKNSTRSELTICSEFTTHTIGAEMITQLIPQQLLLCNWGACNWILIPRALLLCNCLAVISWRQDKQTPEMHTHYAN